VDRTSELAWTHSQVVRQQLNATEAEVQHYEQIASAILYPTSAWHAVSSVIAGSSLGPSALWAYGISGDYPPRPPENRGEVQLGDSAAAGQGPCLLEVFGAGRGSADMERGSLRLPSVAPGRDHGHHRYEPRGRNPGQARGRLRQAREPGLSRGRGAGAVP